MVIVETTMLVTQMTMGIVGIGDTVYILQKYVCTQGELKTQKEKLL
jgi:hypothetical protein